jgi:hypothetical protein
MKLVIDTACEVYDLLKSWADEEFWNFQNVVLQDRTTYVFGRQHLLDNLSLVREMAESGKYQIVFDNSAEGAWTLETQLKSYKIDSLAQEKKILLIAGAKLSDSYAYIAHEHFLPKILDYDENLQSQEKTIKIFSKINKPYKFLFLNGRSRPHRKYLYEQFKQNEILQHALWTMLDSKPSVSNSFSLYKTGVDLMSLPSQLQHLPEFYEVPRYRNSTTNKHEQGNQFIKKELFKKEWGEIYLEPAPYIDTYFSLVTETVCAESAFSFRTEKIAKPLAMGHPFIVASNVGFYRDLHNMGFQTFGHVIDESFDLVDCHQDRMDRIVDIVKDLCQQNLASFLLECYTVCKYNQQRLVEIREQSRQEFPERFFQFLNKYQ